MNSDNHMLVLAYTGAATGVATYATTLVMLATGAIDPEHVAPLLGGATALLLQAMRSANSRPTRTLQPASAAVRLYSVRLEVDWHLGTG